MDTNSAVSPLRGRRARYWLWCGLFVLAGCGGDPGAGEAPQRTAVLAPAVAASHSANAAAPAASSAEASEQAPTGSHPGHGRILYDLIQLTDQPELGRSTFDLNAKGQVAFGERDPEGLLVGKFFDGTTTLAIGRLAERESLPRIALNALGQVAGQTMRGDEIYRAFRWSRTEGMVELGMLPGTDESLATDINDRGEIVGVARLLSQSQPARAVLWCPGANPRDLGVKGNVLPGLRINGAGQVMGTTTGKNGFEQAFTWTKARGPVLLSDRSIRFSEARDINASGQIAGVLGRAVFTGFLWTPGRSLVEFTGDGPVPRAVNDKGTITGTLLGISRAFVWTRAHGLVNLGTFSGGSYSIGADVNNREQVVGEAGTSDASRAFLWTRRDGLVDLNTRLRNPPPGVVLTSAHQINEQGKIIAFTSTNIMVLLVPVRVHP